MTPTVLLAELSKSPELPDEQMEFFIRQNRKIDPKFIGFTELPGNAGAYVITNLRNGRQYVGGSMHIRNRASSHMHALVTGKHSSALMQKDFNESGDKCDVFKIEVFQLCTNVRDTRAAETAARRKFKPYYSVRGGSQVWKRYEPHLKNGPKRKPARRKSSREPAAA